MSNESMEMFDHESRIPKPDLGKTESERQSRGPVTWTIILAFVTGGVAWFAVQRSDLPREVKFSGELPAAVAVNMDDAAARLAAISVPAISLPHFEPIMPPGEHRESFMANCVACHSPRLVTNQPSFPRKKWVEVVQKMVDVFGANIADDDKSKVVDYLISIRGS